MSHEDYLMRGIDEEMESQYSDYETEEEEAAAKQAHQDAKEAFYDGYGD